MERPGSGDTIRAYPPFIGEVSAYHCYTDRGKKSITLNIRADSGKEVLKRLVADADVLLENFRNGTMEKLGLGFEELSKINPALVYGKLSSYGSTGPQKDYIAYDIAVQAQSGIMDATGDPAGEPSRVGCYISDHLSCTYLGTAVILALYHARKTGKGQRVEVSMLDSVVSVMGEKVAALNCGENASRTGHLHDAYAPYDILPCRDGWVALAVTKDSQWAAFCREFGREDWIGKYSSNDDRRASYLEELRPMLVQLLANMSRSEFELRCVQAGVPAGPVNTMEEAVENEHLNGAKCFISNMGPNEGDFVTILAVTDPTKGYGGMSTIIVDRNTPGFTIGKREEKMGIRAADVSELIFENCRVPKSNLLGPEGKGFKIFMEALDEIGRASCRERV